MSKKENVIRAEFCRGPTPSIDVYISGVNQPVSLFRDCIEHCSNKLSGREIEAVIDILASKKRVMLKQHNFPPIYAEMLSDLLDVQRKRYGKQAKKDKKRRLGYSVSGGKLEEILGEYFKIKGVHIYSIDVGNNRDNAAWISLKESDDCYLVLSFREVEEK